MTDRELLEMAARAAGVVAVDGHYWIARDSSGEPHEWNPLTDDGDALRLAIQIGTQGYFGLEVQPTCVQATCLEPWEHCEYEEYKTQDPYAATRRAIVRAAAEIGRAM